MKWGIVGSGKIARRFATDLPLTDGGTLAGVFSQTNKNAERFAADFSTRAYSSFDQLAENVDIIYVATPHPSHKKYALASIEKGKPVLCEKPFTMNAKEAEEVFQFAESRRVFVMEAMWTRFFPAMENALTLVRSGTIGDLVAIDVTFGFEAPYDPASRLFNLELGGGSLRDIGVYCVSLANMFCNEPPTILSARADFAPTGADSTCEWELGFHSRVRATGKSCVTQALPNEARIEGKRGTIRIPQFWHPHEFFVNGEKKEFPHAGAGFQFEANEVMNCIRNRRLESDRMSWARSIRVLQTMDEIARRTTQVGQNLK